MAKLEKFLLVTDKGNVLRVEVELNLFENIKALKISDISEEKSARYYEPFFYVRKVNDFLGSDLAHISQDLSGKPVFSSYEKNEKIIEIYSFLKDRKA